MAQHKSAKKRARQNLKRRARNRHVTSAIRSAVKSLRTAEAKDVPAALRNAEGTIRRAASKGILSKKQASRNVSKLAKRANTASA